MQKRNSLQTLKEFAVFIDAHRGRVLSLADLEQAVEFYRLYPWLNLEARELHNAVEWTVALQCALLPGLRDLLMAEAERCGVDSSPLFTAFELLADVGEALMDLPKPSKAQLAKQKRVEVGLGLKPTQDLALWPDHYYGWPDSFEDTLAKLRPETRNVVRQTEAIFGRLRVLAAKSNRVEPVNNGRTFTPYDLHKLFRLSGPTLKKYAQNANVPTAKRGGCNHRFTTAEVVGIGEAIVKSANSELTRENARKALREIAAEMKS